MNNIGWDLLLKACLQFAIGHWKGFSLVLGSNMLSMYLHVHFIKSVKNPKISRQLSKKNTNLYNRIFKILKSK